MITLSELSLRVDVAAREEENQEVFIVGNELKLANGTPVATLRRKYECGNISKRKSENGRPQK